MPKCSFCGYDISPGTGLIFVKDDGSILSFCSSKCRKSLLKLKRVPAKVKWTAFARAKRV